MADRTVKVDLVGDVRQYTLSVDQAADKTDELRRKAERFDGKSYKAKATVDTDDGKFQKFERMLGRFGGSKYTATADLDSGTATQRARALSDVLARLDVTKASPEAQLKVARFRQAALQVERELIELDGMDPSPDVDVRTAAAEGNLRFIRSELERFDGKTFRAKTELDTKSAVGGVSTLLSGIAAIGPAGVAAGAVAAAGIGGVSTMLATAGVAAISTGLAFVGVGDAVKAMNAYALDPSKENLKAMNDALGRLTVSGQSFARTVTQLKPQLDGLRATAQNGLLPGAEEGLRSLTGLLPNVNNLVARTSEALGQLAARGGAALNDPFWKNYVDFLSREAGPQITSFGNILGNIVKGFAGLQMGFSPVANDMIAGLERMSTSFKNWATTLDSNQSFQEFVQYARENGPLVVSTISEVAKALGSIIAAGAPLGPVVLTAIRGLAEAINALMATGAGPWIVGLAGALGTLNLAMKAVNAVKLSALAQGLGLFGSNATRAGAAGKGAAGGVGTLTGALGLLNPRANAAALQSTKLGQKLESAGGKTAALARGASNVAGALPLIGAAALGAGALVDAFTNSVDEAAQGLQASGIEGSKFRQTLRDQDATLQDNQKTLPGWLNNLETAGERLFGVSRGSDEANRSFNEQLRLLTPLGQSQALAAKAQGDYDDAVIRFGQNSPQAIAALQALHGAQDNVTVQTQLANKSGLEYFQTLGMIASGTGGAADAAGRMVAGLDLAGVAATGATVKITETGQAVATLPNGKQIVLNVNGGDTLTQLQAVAASVHNVPPGKTINVGAITDDAVNRLRGLGLEVVRLPDGTVTVMAQTDAAKVALDNLGRQAQTEQRMPVVVNDQPPSNQIGALQKAASLQQTMPVDANTAPGTGRVNAFEADTAGRRPVPNVDANTGPAMGNVNGWVGYTAGQRPVPTVGANTGPANAASQGWGDFTQGMRPRPAVDADTGQARSAVSSFASWAAGLAIKVAVFANKIGFSAGGIATPMARGGITNTARQVIPNAGGNQLASGPEYGGKKLRRMPNTGARMVSPNSWRVVGDRMDVPELYAPLDGSGRSLSLIAQGAASFGKTLVDASAIYGASADRMRSIRSPYEGMRSIPRAEIRAMAGLGGGDRSIVNTVNVSNPIAERASDSVQRELSKMADLGLFGD